MLTLAKYNQSVNSSKTALPECTPSMHHQSVNSPKTALPECNINCGCLCIRKPGPGTPVPNFVQLGEERLHEDYGNLSSSKTVMCPPFIRNAKDQQASGITAEQKIHYLISQSNLPVYAFYSWKPPGAGPRSGELSDFVLASENAVIGFEVKAFELLNEDETSLAILASVFDKCRKQMKAFEETIGGFLKKHIPSWDIETTVRCPFKVFTVIANAKRVKMQKHIPGDMENKVLFEDELLEKIRMILREQSNEEEKYVVRTLRAWFYGTYCSSNGITLTQRYPYSLLPDINKAHGPKKKNEKVTGVFFSPSQMDVVNSKESFLAIVGLPGTGKTFCLVAKMIEMVIEQRTGNNTDIILFVHENITTLKCIKKLYNESMEALGQTDTSDIVKFMCSTTIEVEDSKYFEVRRLLSEDRSFKVFADDCRASWDPRGCAGTCYPTYDKKVVFCYDYRATDWETICSLLYDKVVFCWLASYGKRQIPASMKIVTLTESLRNSGLNYALSKVLYEKVDSSLETFAFLGQDEGGMSSKFCLSQIMKRRGNPLKLAPGIVKDKVPLLYKPGNRTVGTHIVSYPLDFVHYQDHVMNELIPEYEKRYHHSVIIISEDFPSKFDAQTHFCLEAKGIRHGMWSDFVGQEAECVIFLALPLRGSLVAVARNGQLMEAITRAVSQIVVVHNPEDFDLIESLETAKKSVLNLPTPPPKKIKKITRN